MIDDPTSQELDRLLAEHRATVIEFHADWCVPCRTYGPTFQRVARELRRAGAEDVAFVRVDVDRNHEVANRFGVRSVPTTVVAAPKTGVLPLLKDHRELLRFAGARGHQPLLRALGKSLGIDPR